MHVALIHFGSSLTSALTADSKLVLQHWVGTQTLCTPLTTRSNEVMIKKHLETSLKLVNSDSCGQVCMRRLLPRKLSSKPEVEWAHRPNSHCWTSLPESRQTICCDSVGLATAITSASVMLYLSATLWTRSLIANNSSQCQQLRGSVGQDKCPTLLWGVAELLALWFCQQEPVSFLQTP